MNDDDVLKLYKAGLEELDYNNCMKAVGILYFKNESDNENAEFTEIEINFSQGNYEYVTYLAENFRDKGKRNIDIDEYYYVSLALCNRFPKLRRELRKTKKSPISDYCAHYLIYLFLHNKERINESIGAQKHENSSFRRRYLELVIKDLINLYEMQNELIEVYQNDAEKINEGYLLIDEKIKMISISSPFVNNIKECIKSRILFNPIDIYNLFRQSFKSKGINEKGESLDITQLRDILFMLDLLRRLKLYNVLLEQFNLVEELIFNCIKKQNKTAATYIKELYNELKNYELFYKDELDMELVGDVIKKCEVILNKNFPELLIDSFEKYNNSQIYSKLSDKSKPMYRAAEWQYQAVLSDINYGFRDAGMLCLSYIRLLELEMNSRMLPFIWDNYEVIKDEYNKIKPVDTDSKKKQKSFNYKWGVIEHLKPNSKGKGLTAGEWGVFLNTLSMKTIKTEEEKLYESIVHILGETILNEKGVSALKNGEFAKIFDQETIVEKYRNPPAHTRYVTLDVSLECKQYVERKLLFMEGLFNQV